MSRKRTGAAALSRRTLLAAAAAAPVAAAAAQHARADGDDPIVHAVAGWMEGRDALEALYAEWRAAEHALIGKLQARGLTRADVRAAGAPEARRMRALDRRIAKGQRALDRAATRIVRRQAATPAGALAKIAMGLRIQGPADWNAHAYALIADGHAQLARALL